MDGKTSNAEKKEDEEEGEGAGIARYPTTQTAFKLYHGKSKNVLNDAVSFSLRLDADEIYRKKSGTLCNEVVKHVII